MISLLLVFACQRAAPEAQEEVVPDPCTESPFYADADGDAWGAGPAVLACEAPEGHVARDGDCDDAAPAVHPEAEEVCDGVDDDCDGTIDADASDIATWYADADLDGWGDPATEQRSCVVPPGAVLSGGDCDDARPEVNPGAAEWCGGPDDDCDGLLDEDAVNASPWYADRDGDGYGDGATVALSCTAPAGSIAEDGDCDDSDAAIHPGLRDPCGDGVDQNCDGREICGYTGDYAVEDAVATLSGGSDYAGMALAVVPDADGDGLDDLLVGAPDLRYVAGDDAARLLPGAWIGTGTMSAAALAEWQGGGGAGVGLAVAWIGDPDGDGVEDALVGAPYEDDGSAADAGCAYVVPLDAASGAMDAVATRRLCGAADALGGAGVAGGADADGDGLIDILVGASEAAGLGVSDSGEVYLVSGSGSSAEEALSDAATASLCGGEDEYLGDAVALADLDGDGLAEVVASAWQTASGWENGGIYVAEAQLTGAAAIADVASAALTGAKNYELCGAALEAAGDVDGDGYGDLIASSMLSQSYLCLGPLPSGDCRASSDVLLVGGGSEVAAADFDGDGIVDLATGGAWLSTSGMLIAGSGPISIVYGPWTTGVIDLETGAHAVVDVPARAIVGVDLDGDGTDELVASSFDGELLFFE